MPAPLDSPLRSQQPGSAKGQNRKQSISTWSFRSARDSGGSDEVNLTAGSNPKLVYAFGCRSSEMEPIPSATADREHNADVRAEPLHIRRIGKPIIVGLGANSDDVIFCENRQLALQKPSSSQKTSEEWPTGRIRSRHARQFA